LELRIGTVGLDAEQKRGPFLGLEDFGLLDDDVQHRVIPNRAIYKGDVDRGWQALIYFGQLQFEVLLSIGLVDECQTDIRQSHHEFGRGEEAVQTVSSIPGLCVTLWGPFLLLELFFGEVGAQDNI
jgi:hypothetical protein